jgi:hypothetical protein
MYFDSAYDQRRYFRRTLNRAFRAACRYSHLFRHSSAMACDWQKTQICHSVAERNVVSFYKRARCFTRGVLNIEKNENESSEQPKTTIK